MFMKKLKKQIFIVAMLLGSTIALNATINSYSFDESTKDVQLHKEFKEGDLNPYWFQEYAQTIRSYAYEASDSAVFYKEFKKGDFNPYWFEL